MTKQDDTEYRDAEITEVTPQGSGEGWTIKRSDGWSFYVPNKGIEPRVGDTARFYGRGIGSIVRGLDIAGREVFYRTSLEQEEQNQRDLEAADVAKREKFDRDRASLDADYSAMPLPFRQRLDGFRERNASFRWEYESYESFCCKEAVKIATAFPSEAEVKFFWKQDSEQQKAALPSLAYDRHSGNKFDAACRLAWLYVSRPELIPQEHGALCPLVGCQDYGCYSTIANAASSPRPSGIIVYGAGCVWWDIIENAARTQIPSCPFCGSVLFQFEDEKAFWAGTDAYERTHPGYIELLKWLKGKCFKSMQLAALAYEAETGVHYTVEPVERGTGHETL